ncbi:MAG: penicillin-binding protein E [Ignavibacteriales bacterium CG18_big_fil_WC_8_21_14_2_50_31_20]|nr:MAG: penicillin-binding protein E [Ignavibacteriales bacterium CG18_big_fil_WC_8_21_14_2_50_31_20]
MKKTVLFVLLGLILISCTAHPTLEMKIDSIFSEFNKSTPGASVLVVQNNKIIFEKGYGLANIEQAIPNESKTNFRLASITKQFTAFSILLLENDGKLSFDDSLEKYFPNFPEYGKNITIKQVLQHTSGLLAYEDYIDDTVTVQLKDKDVLNILMKQDSKYFQPGTEHRYSNSGYAVLALIVEKISGKTFAEFLKERIFLPLKMNNSVAFENGISEVQNRAFGYAKIDSEFVFTDQSVTSAVLGDGGIYSSTLEMVKWNNEIDSPTLISKEKFSKAFEKLVLPNGEVVNYGFGWRLDPYKNYERPYHTGSTSGFSNMFMKIPELDLVFIVLMNVRDYDAKNYAEKIADLFIEN